MRKCCANCGWLYNGKYCGIPTNMIKTPEYIWVRENVVELNEELVLREHDCAFFEQKLEADCG